MERAALLRSLARNRFFFRSARRVSRSCSSLSSRSAAKRHRLIPDPSRRSLLRQRLTSSASSLNFRRSLSSLSPRAVATSPSPASPEFFGVQDEVAEKLGFEKVSEQFIGECKSKAVLFKHKKTGAEVMSVLNDDENKVFGIVFRTPP